MKTSREGAVPGSQELAQDYGNLRERMSFKAALESRPSPHRDLLRSSGAHSSVFSRVAGREGGDSQFGVVFNLIMQDEFAT